MDLKRKKPDKKNNKGKERCNTDSGPAADIKAGTDDTQKKFKDKPADVFPAPEQQIAELKEKNEEYYNCLLRLQADFENFRKRTVREKEEIYRNITGEVITDFLNVLDNMERASSLAAKQDNNKNNASFKEGIDMIISQFKEVLAKYDVEKIPALGAKFDPNYHYAVMQEKGTDVEGGTVLEEIQGGYMIKKRVLRPSIVKVAL